MATYINNIFNFGRSLPSPFDTIANKKIKVSSKYGDGTTSTLCGTVIKAVHAVCHCMDGSGEGAVQRSIGNVPQHKFSSKSCVLWALGT